FRFCVEGIPIRSGSYHTSPPLFRRSMGSYRQDGHMHLLELKGGRVEQLRSVFLHDDRKSIDRFIGSHRKYALHEVEVLLKAPTEKLTKLDRLRRDTFLMPILSPIYFLMIRGGIMDGARGISFALQRLLFETFVWLTLRDRKLGYAEADGPP